MVSSNWRLETDGRVAPNALRGAYRDLRISGWENLVVDEEPPHSQPIVDTDHRLFLSPQDADNGLNKIRPR